MITVLEEQQLDRIKAAVEGDFYAEALFLVLWRTMPYGRKIEQVADLVIDIYTDMKERMTDVDPGH